MHIHDSDLREHLLTRCSGHVMRLAPEDGRCDVLQDKIEVLLNMLETIALHPDTPPLIKAYARGELHSPNPIDSKGAA